MINNGKNKGKGIGLVMRSRILSSLLVLGCAVPVAAPVLQPLSVYAEETAGTPSETDPAAPAEDQAATTEITVQDGTGENYVTDEFEDGDFVLEDDTIVSDDEGASVDFSAVQTLLANALDLADQDMEGNLGAIQALLDSASSLVSSDYPQVSLLIDSASSLISSGAANLGTLKTVINSALSALS